MWSPFFQVFAYLTSRRGFVRWSTYVKWKPPQNLIPTTHICGYNRYISVKDSIINPKKARLVGNFGPKCSSVSIVKGSIYLKASNKTIKNPGGTFLTRVQPNQPGRVLV